MFPFLLTICSFTGLQVGDPLEKAALKGIDWVYTSDEKAMPKKYVLDFLLSFFVNHYN